MWGAVFLTVGRAQGLVIPVGAVTASGFQDPVLPCLTPVPIRWL